MEKFCLAIGLILLFYAGAILLSLKWQGVMILDLISLLLPYWIGLNLLIILGLAALFFKADNHLSQKILSSSGILIGVLTLLMISKLVNFAYIKTPPGQGQFEL